MAAPAMPAAVACSRKRRERPARGSRAGGSERGLSGVWLSTMPMRLTFLSMRSTAAEGQTLRQRVHSTAWSLASGWPGWTHQNSTTRVLPQKFETQTAAGAEATLHAPAPEHRRSNAALRRLPWLICSFEPGLTALAPAVEAAWASATGVCLRNLQFGLPSWNRAQSMVVFGQRRQRSAHHTEPILQAGALAQSRHPGAAAAAHGRRSRRTEALRRCCHAQPR